MCMLAVAEKRKLSNKEFKNCWDNNKDGVGFAWKENGKNVYEKGFMKFDEAREFHKLMTPPYVVHFRLASSGGVTPKLTHPFIMGESKHRATLEYSGDKHLLFHNGVVTDWEKMFRELALTGVHFEKPFNDTMVVAVLAQKLIDTGYSYKDIFDTCGVVNGRYVVMDDKNFKLFGYGFTDVNGVHFSNDSYKETTYKKSSVFSNYKSKYSKKTDKVTASAYSDDGIDDDFWYEKHGYRY